MTPGGATCVTIDEASSSDVGAAVGMAVMATAGIWGALKQARVKAVTSTYLLRVHVDRDAEATWHWLGVKGGTYLRMTVAQKKHLETFTHLVYA
ncbi:unnamed protein product [Acanthoscelides obtectus]|uniref:Uncharacterized protein n=1 Tax=Acanthoscelides obtectus TaxID=200917 RepID=A0A9P0PJQ0_ACAOB|nr:unnamed protein product [Acanthoscelides obtectus]CAK1620160.1 hypothetical protein AOBTE_LOCUS227 [Acanthoscelides obtectus]